MSEINNNIHNYGYKIERIDSKKDNVAKQQPIEVQQEMPEQNYAVDTGVLGRSQIHGIKGGNIAKSVDEAVYMAENCPVKMCCCDAVFDKMYQDYLDEGKDEGDAYIMALLGQDELLDITEAYNK